MHFKLPTSVTWFDIYTALWNYHNIIDYACKTNITKLIKSDFKTLIILI